MRLLLLSAFVLTSLCFSTTRGQTPSENDVRVVNGPDQFSGIVEIYRNGGWGRVCPTGWNAASTGVVCRQLGFDQAVSFHTAGEELLVNWETSSVFNVASVTCAGSEDRLSDCTIVPDSPSCSAGDAVGVVCKDFAEGDFRLVDGFGTRGTVEIFVSGAWYPVCTDTLWNEQTQRLLCQQLGQPNSFVFPSAMLQSNVAITGNISCSSSDSSLEECLRGRVMLSPNNQCTSGQAFVLLCSQTEGNVRLVGGPLPNSGQIEMFHNGGWRALCASGWSDQAAAVACGQMGFLSASTWFASPDLTTIVPSGSAGTHRSVNCTGTEERLFDCDFVLDLRATSCPSGNATTILVCQGIDTVPTVTMLSATLETITISMTLPGSGTQQLSTVLEHPSSYTLTYATQSMNAPETAITADTLVRNGLSATANFTTSDADLLPFILYRGNIALAVQGEKGPQVMRIFYADLEDLVTVDVTSTTARIQWPPLSTATVSVVGYGLSYRVVMPSGLEDQDSEVAGPGAMSAVLNGLQEGVRYSLVLIPTGVSLPVIAGTRLWIEYSTMFSTLSDVPSGPPLNLTIVQNSITSSSAQLSWESPNIIDRNGEITGYSISFNFSTSTETRVAVSASSTGSAHTYQLLGLQADRNYTVFVAAMTVNGTGPSASVSLTTMKAIGGAQDDGPTLTTVPIIVAGVIILVALLAIIIVMIVAAICIWQRKYRGSYDPKASYWVQPHNGMLGMEPSESNGETTQSSRSRDRARVEDVEERHAPLEVVSSPKLQEGSYDSLSPKEISAIISETNGNNNSKESLVGDLGWNPYACPLIHNKEEENHYEGVTIPPHTYEEPQSVESKKSHTLPTNRFGASQYTVPKSNSAQYSNIPGTNIVDATNVAPQYANTLDAAELRKIQNSMMTHAGSLSNGVSFLGDGDSFGYATPRKFPVYDSIQGSTSFRFDVTTPEQSGTENGMLTSSTPVPASGLF